MNPKTKVRRGLHLVTAQEAAALVQPQQQGTPVESTSFIAVMVQYYRELKEELAGLCDEQDQERSMALRAKKKAVRQCLAVYGVPVGV
jgi:hypothetical protein